MIIGIDGNEANVKNRVGIGEFAFGVINGLHDLDEKNQYRIYLKQPPLADLPGESKNWQYRVFGPQFLWTQWRLPLEISLARPGLGVFFSPSHYAPRFCPVPSVISIMDLWHHHHPDQFNKKDIYQLKKWEAYSVKKSSQIITISEFTKSEIIKFYHYSKKKITVAYPGIESVSSIKYLVSSIKKIKIKYGIEKDYILYLGTLQPKKNLIGLINAFSILNTKYLIQNTNLVIAGKKGWLYEEIFNKVKDLGLEEKIVFTDFVPDEDKNALIAGAKCFVLPSLYEGFGIPVLEAMRLGVPVAISKVASLPEVGGKAAFYFDPKNPESIAETIGKVLKLSVLDRKKTIEAGKARVREFTWEKCARKILKVLEEVGVN